MSRSFIVRFFAGVTALVVVTSCAVSLYYTYEQWLPWVTGEFVEADETEGTPQIKEPKMLRLTPQARENLGLVSAPAKPEVYWRTIQLPGVIADQPGVSDRGVTSPAEGVITQVHAFAGDTVKPGETLFTIRLLSESLHTTQSDLFKATREIELVNEERERIKKLASEGTIAGRRIIELDQEIRRQRGLIQAYQQDLMRHGLVEEQISQIGKGEFVTSLEVTAPPVMPAAESSTNLVKPVVFLEPEPRTDVEIAYEVQNLKVDLGQQVQAGQLLSMLSNHRVLYVEGHAFKREATWLEQAAQEGRAIEIEFAEDDRTSWPPIEQTFEIRHIANTIDPVSRTFNFYIPLTNQARAYKKQGEVYVVWRFRPGQRVRLRVPVERFEGVIVLPAEAVAREGPEAYVFRQNGDLFNRLPVNVLHEDRRDIVIANDGSVTPGTFLAQGSAASLNRVMKAQAASGVKVNLHVHADGTVHEAH